MRADLSPSIHGSPFTCFQSRCCASFPWQTDICGLKAGVAVCLLARFESFSWRKGLRCPLCLFASSPSVQRDLHERRKLHLSCLVVPTHLSLDRCSPPSFSSSLSANRRASCKSLSLSSAISLPESGPSVLKRLLLRWGFASSRSRRTSAQRGKTASLASPEASSCSSEASSVSSVSSVAEQRFACVASIVSPSPTSSDGQHTRRRKQSCDKETQTAEAHWLTLERRAAACAYCAPTAVALCSRNNGLLPLPLPLPLPSCCPMPTFASFPPAYLQAHQVSACLPGTRVQVPLSSHLSLCCGPCLGATNALPALAVHGHQAMTLPSSECAVDRLRSSSRPRDASACHCE